MTLNKKLYLVFIITITTLYKHKFPNTKSNYQKKYSHYKPRKEKIYSVINHLNSKKYYSTTVMVRLLIKFEFSNSVY